MTKWIILDLDGSIVTTDPNFMKMTKFEQDEYVKNNIRIAPPIKQTKHFLSILSHQNFKTIVVSARYEHLREVTEKWLEDNAIEYDELHLRSNDDKRPDVEYKSEVVDRLIDLYGMPYLAFEDRLDVIDEFNKKGIFCFGVRDAN